MTSCLDLDMPNSWRMDAGNFAFAGLRNVIGKMNLLSSFQMSEEPLASGRRKNLKTQAASPFEQSTDPSVSARMMHSWAGIIDWASEPISIWARVERSA